MPNARTLGGIAAATIGLAATVTALYEGYSPTPYPDAVGVVTVCRGHAGATPGRTYSTAECGDLFQSDLWDAYSAVGACITAPLTIGQAAALTDFAFNVGRGALCRSTLARMANAGEPAGQWCRQLRRFTWAGHRKLRGLVRRRESEVALCLR